MITNNKIIPKVYYIFMFLLPIVFYPNILDYVLLPRQVFLSLFLGFTLFLNFILKERNKSLFNIKIIHIAVLSYFIIAIISTIFKSSITSESYYVLSKQLILFTYFFSTVYFLKIKAITTKQIVISVLLFTITALCTSLYNIIEKGLRGQHLFRQIDIIAGGFANKNLLASILYLCIPFLLIRFQSKNKIFVFKLLLLLTTISVLFIIRTRSALIGVLVFSIITLHFYLKNKIQKSTRWLTISGITLITASIFFLQKNGILGTSLSSTDHKKQYLYRIFDTGTLSSRFKFWGNSIKMFWDNFLIGVGPGNWQVHFPKYGLDYYTDFNFINGLMTIQRPHNDFLWQLCETGILGFIAFYSFIGIILYRLLKIISRETNLILKWNFQILFAGVIGYLFVSFFDFPSERIEHQVLVMTLLAISYFYSSNTLEEKSFKKLKARGVFVLVISIILFSGYMSYSRILSEKEVIKLYTSKQKGDVNKVLLHAKTANKLFYQIDMQTMPIDWYLGNAYFTKKDFNQSLHHFQKAYNLTPFNLLIINNLASCNEKLGNPNKAIELYQKALTISSKIEESRIQLAAVYFNINQYEKAFETIKNVPIDSKNRSYIPFLTAILQAKIHTITVQNNIISIPKKYGNNQYLIEKYFESKNKKISFSTYILNQIQ